MKLLVTGGAGFIGANFILYWMKKHPDDQIVNLDKLTYAGNLENLKDVEKNPNYSFAHGDISDSDFVQIKDKLVIKSDKFTDGENEVEINFEGELNDKLAGFYRSDYDEDGKTKYLATTQFEAADARQAFPCFDEPAYKATFDITLVVDKDLTAISNMPELEVEMLENGKKSITGSTGLVGSRLVELLKDEFTFIPLTSKEIDITDTDAVIKTLNDTEYDLLLHLAAYTNVDGAEIDRDLAYKINVKGTENLLNATIKKDADFIYISTGFVFDGVNPPYFEDSTPNPISYYGQTKFEAEELVKENGMIVRIEYPYGNSPAPKKDIGHLLKSLLEQGKTITMIEDSLMTPTFIDDIAFGLKHLMNNYSEEVHHIVGASAVSPYNLAKSIAKNFNLDESLVHATTLEEYFKGKAKRPQFADVRSKKNDFYTMKSIEEGIPLLK